MWINDITLDNVIYIKNEGTIINGNGHTVDAGNKNRIFCFQAKNIVLKNMKLINADPEIVRTWSGGAVHWESGVDNKLYILKRSGKFRLWWSNLVCC